KNPAEERPWGAKALVNACREHKYLPIFSQRTVLTHSMYDRVADRWSELGLDDLGEPPRLLAFQEDMRPPANPEFSDLRQQMQQELAVPPCYAPSRYFSLSFWE